MRTIIFLHLLSLVLFSQLTFAGKAMVIVLESPIFLKKSWDSPVVQQARKGEVVFIHNKHMGVSSFGINYGVERGSTTDDEDGEFLQTLDNNGNARYIPRKHVKIIYQDAREFKTSVTPWKKDPTDYRLEEPLPDHYPLAPKSKWRGIVSLGVGPSPKVNYNYPTTSDAESFDGRKGFLLHFLKKVSFDNTDRFYFGGAFHGFNESRALSLSNGVISQEADGYIGVGPYISYDVYRSKDYILGLSGGIIINYRRLLVGQHQGTTIDERIYQGFFISPKIASTIKKRNFINESLSLVLGIEMQMNLAHTISTTTEAIDQTLWEEDDSFSFSSPFSAQYAVFLGIQTSI